MINKLGINLKKLKGYADWNLLIFLVLFLNVKLIIKIPAIIIIYLLQSNVKFGFRLRNSRLPLFYLLVIGIALFNWALNANYHNTGYTLVLLTGIGFWLMCILASHQIKYSVEHHSVELIHRTILIFFILNAAVSVGDIALIMRETHSLNPYLYKGQYQKYFIGTGDFIKGVSFDTSTINAMLNAFGVVYFITRKNIRMMCVCMAVLLLTGSNATNVIAVIVLLFLFLFRSDKVQKSMVLICILLMGIFLAKVSPENNKYALKTVANMFGKQMEAAYQPPAKLYPLREIPDKFLSYQQRRRKVAQMFIDSVSAVEYKKKHPNMPVPRHLPSRVIGPLTIPQPDFNSGYYQANTDTDAGTATLLRFIHRHRAILPLSGQQNHTGHLPGKMIGMLQTFSFLQHHTTKALTGDGMGNFSSKLAFRVADLGFAGGYPHNYYYIAPDFLTNHLDVYLNFFSKPIGYRSLTNSPYSTYDQMLGEYGLLGLLVFLIGYLWFFARHYKYLTYGIPVLLLMLAGFFTDYWFEQLSVVVFFELLLFLDIKEQQSITNPLLATDEK